MKLLDIHFLELLKHGSAEKVYKVQIIDLQLIDVIQPNSLTPQSYSINKRYLIKYIILKYQKLQLEKQYLKFLLESRDLIFGLAISKEHHVVQNIIYIYVKFQLLFDWLQSLEILSLLS
ncbi:unnamed protein product [Paramecium primaurelia]|uniref:Uncharacterized protein n=1 Tax=Paramecium primaurelia TaxID=5886 RepID=A0A8S1MJH3_PARPR|nr:unnamed protein product [Paramecium primaurelia]